MNSNKSAFVAGVVAQCNRRGVSPALALSAVGFEKQASGKGLLQAIKDLTPGAKGALIGAGLGGVGGMMFSRKNRGRNALLGALAGGGLGYGAGRLFGTGAQDEVTVRPEDTPYARFKRELDPASFEATQKATATPQEGWDQKTINTLGHGPTPIRPAYSRYIDPTIFNLVKLQHAFRETGAPSPVKNTFSWALDNR